MTEAEWLAEDLMGGMLTFLRGKISDRRLRLFAVGCCRRNWKYLTDARSRAVVEAAERLADDEVVCSDLGPIWEAATRAEVKICKAKGYNYKHEMRHVGRALFNRNRHAAFRWAVAASRTILETAELAARTTECVAKVKELEANSALLRDIFGNPFRPVNFDAEWRTSTAVLLAKQMYESRDFSTMPILADALQDAGCDNADILSHCRDANGVHVRGCWVVDLVLGKE